MNKLSTSFVTSLTLLLVLSLGLGACGSATTIGTGDLIVTGLAPGQTLLCASGQGGPGGSTVIVLGSGFLSEHGADVRVLWTATDATPFNGGTSATTTSMGTVLSDTQVEVQIPPATGVFTVIFTVTLPGGNSGSSEPQSISIGGVLVGPFGNFDQYDATGNVPLTVTADNGVLENDTPVFCAEEGEVDTKPAASGASTSHTPFTLTSAGPATGQGGTVAANADGSFTYNPPVGFTGTDSFSYEFEQAGRTGFGFVQITVADMVWFIDSDAPPMMGSGHFNAPFRDLAEFQAAQQAAGARDPAAGHTIFIYDEGTNDPYDGGITLLDGQRLFGEGHGLNIGGQQVVPAAGRPTLINSLTADGERPGDIVVRLANGNEVRGLDIEAPAQFGIFGVGVAGPCTIDQVGIDGTNSNGIHLDGISGVFTIGNDAPTASPSVTVRGCGNHGIFLRGSSQQLSLTAGLSASDVVNIYDVLINGAASNGIEAEDIDLDIRNTDIDACQTGVRHSVFSENTCAFSMAGAEIGVNTPMNFRGVDLNPSLGGTNAFIATSEVHATDNALRAGSTTGTLTISLDTNVFQCLVTGVVYTVDLIGDMGAIGNTVVTQMNDNDIIGNGQGEGFNANSVLFDANPATMAFETVEAGTSLFGQSAAARVEGTALILGGCEGSLNFTSLTIWQVGGSATGFSNSGTLTLTFGTKTVNGAP